MSCLVVLWPPIELSLVFTLVIMSLDMTARVRLWDSVRGEPIKESPDSTIELVDLIDSFDDVEGDAYYIVDINVAAKFEIAKPTTNYMMLLRFLLAEVVGHQDLLKRIMKLMCAITTESSKVRACTCHHGGEESMCEQSKMI
ncbi:hypothetical protein OPV22_012355 [Ensete ventricosum]|uniref:Uncharacterized protein n=1 Tax=Ensete ventricosum TaxID=4639 RepID=A0AAV8QYE1_ENSVE|nr:hypothetical protein OPV22_012355 [Ensete ventricosum]